MSSYAASITVPAGGSAQVAPSLLPMASRHTIQIEGDGPVTCRGRLVGAATFGDIDTGLGAGLYSDLVAHRLEAFEFTNTGGAPVTIHIAGGA